MASLTQNEFEQTQEDSERQESLVLQSTGLQRVRHDRGLKNNKPRTYISLTPIQVLSSLLLLFVCFDFWLCGVFVVIYRLPLVAKSGTTLHCRVWASHCSGFFLLLQSTGSRVDGSQQLGTVAQLHPSAWDLPGLGVEPVFPALERRVPFFFLIYFKLRGNCLTMLCWFLPYTNANQP